MKFNWIIIPLIIAATAYIGARYTKQGLGDWYNHLRKPKNTPSGELIGSIWTFIYITIAVAVLWFWNIPAFTWYHYVVAVVLLYNAYLNATWNKTFFVEKDLEGAYKKIRLLVGVTILVIAMMAWKSPIASVMLVPYWLWLLIATQLAKRIVELNKHQN
jgi:benzodiazapine receptor